jgi:hypothetical protein
VLAYFAHEYIQYSACLGYRCDSTIQVHHVHCIWCELCFKSYEGAFVYISTIIIFENRFKKQAIYFINNYAHDLAVQAFRNQSKHGAWNLIMLNAGIT